jgi:hypothetical protein
MVASAFADQSDGVSTTYPSRAFSQSTNTPSIRSAGGSAKPGCMPVTTTRCWHHPTAWSAVGSTSAGSRAVSAHESEASWRTRTETVTRGPAGSSKSLSPAERRFSDGCHYTGRTRVVVASQRRQDEGPLGSASV